MQVVVSFFFVRVPLVGCVCCWEWCDASGVNGSSDSLPSAYAIRRSSARWVLYTGLINGAACYLLLLKLFRGTRKQASCFVSCSRDMEASKQKCVLACKTVALPPPPASAESIGWACRLTSIGKCTHPISAPCTALPSRGSETRHDFQQLHDCVSTT